MFDILYFGLTGLFAMGSLIAAAYETWASREIPWGIVGSFVLFAGLFLSGLFVFL